MIRKKGGDQGVPPSGVQGHSKSETTPERFPASPEGEASRRRPDGAASAASASPGLPAALALFPQSPSHTPCP